MGIFSDYQRAAENGAAAIEVEGVSCLLLSRFSLIIDNERVDTARICWTLLAPRTIALVRGRA